jgi:hypothetical protein
MASSTTIPMAMESEVSEMTLMEFPVIKRYRKATISDMGIVRTIIKVALHRPRKKSTTKTTNRNAHIRVFERLLIDPLIKSEVSMIRLILTSGGRLFLSSSIFFRTSLATFMVLAPDCFITNMRRPVSPLIFSSSDKSFSESRQRHIPDIQGFTCHITHYQVFDARTGAEFTLHPQLVIDTPILTFPEGRFTFSAVMALPICSMVRL